MKSRKKADAVATVGTYKDKVTGEEKKRYANVGTLFESEDGRLSLKLDTIPIGPGWSGYIQFFEPRTAGHDPPRAVGKAMPPAPAPVDPSEPNPDDDIPF